MCVFLSYTDLYPIKDKATGMEGLYWCVDYPWPLSDRDVSITITSITTIIISYTSQYSHLKSTLGLSSLVQPLTQVFFPFP